MKQCIIAYFSIVSVVVIGLLLLPRERMASPPRDGVISAAQRSTTPLSQAHEGQGGEAGARRRRAWSAPQTRRLTIRVVDAHERPLPGFELRLRSDDQGSGFDERRYATNVDGQVVRSVPATASFSFSLTGRYDVEYDPPWEDEGRKSGGVSMDGRDRVVVAKVLGTRIQGKLQVPKSATDIVARLNLIAEVRPGTSSRGRGTRFDEIKGRRVSDFAFWGVPEGDWVVAAYWRVGDAHVFARRHTRVAGTKDVDLGLLRIDPGKIEGVAEFNQVLEGEHRGRFDLRIATGPGNESKLHLWQHVSFDHAIGRKFTLHGIPPGAVQLGFGGVLQPLPAAWRLSGEDTQVVVRQRSELARLRIELVPSANIEVIAEIPEGLKRPTAELIVVDSAGAIRARTPRIQDGTLRSALSLREGAVRVYVRVGDGDREFAGLATVKAGSNAQCRVALSEAAPIAVGFAPKQRVEGRRIAYGPLRFGRAVARATIRDGKAMLRGVPRDEPIEIDALQAGVRIVNADAQVHIKSRR